MQTKAITRFDLGDGPQPACIYSAATPNLAAATNYQDLWWVAERRGIRMGHQLRAAGRSRLRDLVHVRPRRHAAVAFGAGPAAGHEQRLHRDTLQDVGTAIRPIRSGADSDPARRPGHVHVHRRKPRDVRVLGDVRAVAGAGAPDEADHALSVRGNRGTICQTIPDPQLRVSAPTPFAPGCEGTPVNGTLYANAEVEPYVAANPLNPSNLIGVWQQDRWSNGGSKGLLTGASFDGGRTWTRSMAAFSRCTGGNAAQRRRLRAGVRPVGRDRRRRRRVPDRDRFQRRHFGRRLVGRGAREPVGGRRTHVERAGHADPRRRRQLQRQGIDRRRSVRRGQRLRGVGPARRCRGTGRRISPARPTAA